MKRAKRSFPFGTCGYRGTVIHSLDLGQLEIIRDGIVVVDSEGFIIQVFDMSQNPDVPESLKVQDLSGKLIMPGFVDGHAHAPQYAFTGTGMDLPLLQWLEKYTFPCESKFSDLEFALEVYEKSVKRHLKFGTTFCSYFATIHMDACKVLTEVARTLGQRAYIGKVSMDRNSPDFYCENTEDAIDDAEAFVQHVLEVSKQPLPAKPGCKKILAQIRKSAVQRNMSIGNLTDCAEDDDEDSACTLSSPTETTTSTPDSSKDGVEDSSEEDIELRARGGDIILKGKLGSAKKVRTSSDDTTTGVVPKVPLVLPVVTPRFVPSCTSRLLGALGQISRRYAVPVQSHLSESPGEIAWVRELHPECDTYTGVYDRYGLLHDRAYYAHCCHCSKGERKMMQVRGAGVVHCASSNFMLGSGVLNVRRLLQEGVKVGLGTDVAGGYSSSMLDALRQALIASQAVSFGGGAAPDEEEGECPKTYDPLSFQEAFHLATQGGAEVLGMGNHVGNFLPGKQFDALVVDPRAEDSPFDLFPDQGPDAAFEKFLFLGDDRNIAQVFVGGRKVIG